MTGQEQLLLHWGAMVSVGLKILGSRHDAEDCAAEALVAACEQDLDNVRNMEAFLVTLAKRRAYDMQRRELSSRRREARYVADSYAEDDDLADAVTTRAVADHADRLAQELLSPVAYQLLSFVAEGVPVPAAAGQLGITARSAEGHLRRARSALRAALTGALTWLQGVRIKVRPPSRTVASLAPAAFTMLVTVALHTLAGMGIPPMGWAARHRRSKARHSHHKAELT